MKITIHSIFRTYDPDGWDHVREDTNFNDYCEAHHMQGTEDELEKNLKDSGFHLFHGYNDVIEFATHHSQDDGKEL